MIDYSNIQVGEEPYFPVMSWATAGFEQTEQLPNSILTNYIVLESEYKEDLYFTGGVACLVGVYFTGSKGNSGDFSNFSLCFNSCSHAGIFFQGG